MDSSLPYIIENIYGFIYIENIYGFICKFYKGFIILLLALVYIYIYIYILMLGLKYSFNEIYS